MRITLLAIKHKPTQQGGNGKPPPLAQVEAYKQLMLLFPGWVCEYAVATGLRKKTKIHPTCYKIDVAHPERKIAVEVDGNSHQVLARKAQDQKKDGFLRSQGWFVFRFLNKEVLNNWPSCLDTIMSTISR